MQIDECCIQAHLDEVIKAAVEETLNGYLENEAPVVWAHKGGFQRIIS